MDLSTHPHRPVILWLYVTAGFVFAMAVIGAITRLTESGLSMVEWRLLIDTIPPLSQAEWERVFALYKTTPEFIHKNSWMGLEDFKRIFFWEWFHRLWGRLIGLVYALPLVYFWLRGRIPAGYKGKFLFLLALGGLQGFMGWFMVESGLVDEPAVSHYRLAAHLSLAFIIFCVLLWYAFDLTGAPRSERGTTCQQRHGWFALGVLAITIVWGAFTAGLDGGMIYNTWPKVDQNWVAPEIFLPFGWLENAGGVQFVHRWLAIAALALIVSFAWRRKDVALTGMAFFQVALGIATVLTQVNIPVAAAHQAGALILLALMMRQLHEMRG